MLDAVPEVDYKAAAADGSVIEAAVGVVRGRWIRSTCWRSGRSSCCRSRWIRATSTTAGWASIAATSAAAAAVAAGAGAADAAARALCGAFAFRQSCCCPFDAVQYQFNVNSILIHYN